MASITPDGSLQTTVAKPVWVPPLETLDTKTVAEFTRAHLQTGDDGVGTDTAS